MRNNKIDCKIDMKIGKSENGEIMAHFTRNSDRTENC